MQEALNNVVKHAHAAHAQVNLEMDAESLVVSIEDDGSGFNPDEVDERGDRSKALGLGAMRQRAEMLGGQIAIESFVGRGTTITAAIPAAIAGASADAPRRPAAAAGPRRLTEPDVILGPKY